MNIPDDALEEFKCSDCKGFLSQSPVYLRHDGVAVCGQCHAPERPATRNKQYEAAARFLRFPCRNRDHGCRHMVCYAAQQVPDKHEEMCEHRQYVCPVFGSRCDWLGSHGDILQHCQAQHPDRVLDSPCTLTHDISKPSHQTYLLRALQVLFLLHTKICVATGNLYHAVRFLGASDEAADFSYTLDIRRGRELLSKDGQVAAQDCLAIQKPMALALDMNSLLGVLGVFDGTTFTLAVKESLRKTCAGCGARLVTLLYRDKDGWKCDRCAPARRACENQGHGCQHKDINKKCRKHELYFCEQRTQCWMCYANMSRGALLPHYGSAHGDVTYLTGSTWRATQSDVWYRIVSGAAGTAVCSYCLLDTKFELAVRTPVSSTRLKEFLCMVRVTDPTTGLAHTFTPEALYDETCDWRIIAKKEELPSWSGEFDVCVEITYSES